MLSGRDTDRDEDGMVELKCSETFHYNPGEYIGFVKPSSCVYKGKFGTRVSSVQAAVKCFDCSSREMKQAVQFYHNNILTRSRHENILRCFTHREEPNRWYILYLTLNKLLLVWLTILFDHRFIVTEPCLCSLADLFGKHYRRLNSNVCAHIVSCLPNEEIMSQITNGIGYLHRLGVAHTNLHPNNILIFAVDDFTFQIRLSDMILVPRRFRKKYTIHSSGKIFSDEWSVPEEIQQELSLPQYQRMDSFLLGCIIPYVYFGGSHLFGETDVEREYRMKNQYDVVYQPNWNGEAEWAQSYLNKVT